MPTSFAHCNHQTHDNQIYVLKTWFWAREKGKNRKSFNIQNPTRVKKKWKGKYV